MDLNTWGYPNDVGLINKCDQMVETITNIVIDKSVIQNAVTNAINPLNERIDDVNEHIDTAKTEIMENCTSGGESGNDGCCGCCNVATKCDLRNAVNAINSHIDEKLDSYDFEGKFGDINDQINELLNG